MSCAASRRTAAPVAAASSPSASSRCTTSSPAAPAAAPTSRTRNARPPTATAGQPPARPPQPPAASPRDPGLPRRSWIVEEPRLEPLTPAYLNDSANKVRGWNTVKQSRPQWPRGNCAIISGATLDRPLASERQQRPRHVGACPAAGGRSFTASRLISPRQRSGRRLGIPQSSPCHRSSSLG